MSPEANAALLRIKADYPDVQWAQDMPNTVILWFDHVKAFVHLVGEEMDPPIELDEARARSALDALLGVTSVPDGGPMEAEPFVVTDEMATAMFGPPVVFQDPPPPTNDGGLLPDPSNSAPTAPPVDPQPVPEGEPPAPQPPAEG